MRKVSTIAILLTLWVGPFLAAGNCQVKGTTTAPRFSAPQIVTNVNPRPTIAGHFHCSKDGTIYAFVDGYTASADRPALLGIHPDGSVTNFNWSSVQGYARVYGPRSVFVGYEHVYVLAKAKEEIAGGKNGPGFVALTFNLDGKLLRATPLERWTSPWVLGAFKSGNMVLLSEDRLNHRMTADLIAPEGGLIRELDFGNEDYLALASAMPNGPGKYDPSFLIASSTFHPFGNNLLLAPTVISGLPVITLNEEGVVNAVALKVPKDSVLDQFISSTSSTTKLRLGTIIPDPHPILNSKGKQMGIMGFTPSLNVTEISLADGRILHQASFGSTDVQPACEADGILHLLTSSGTAGYLSVTTESGP